jgi:hypothetical protein
MDRSSYPLDSSFDGHDIDPINSIIKPTNNSEGVLEPSSPLMLSKTVQKIGSIRFRREAHTHAEELIQAAIRIYTDKNSLKK